jgi:quinolinate synthase
MTPFDLYEKLKKIDVGHSVCTYTLERCFKLAPLVNRVLELKAEKNAVILAHSYVHADITATVADFVGDSYGLAKSALSAPQETILFPAVRFMAETAKILNPGKTVIDPNPNGGCSLADSIDAETVLRLRKRYPKHTFVCYINTTAEVKAVCDVCVTSSNAEKILENLPNDQIYFLPDKLMGENLRRALEKRGIDKEILYYDGTCYVHEEFEPSMIDSLRREHPNAIVVAHPECSPKVVEKADSVGSTTQMLEYVAKRSGENRPFLLLTECGIASRLQMEVPKARLIGGCVLCKFMRSNSLLSLIDALENPSANQIVEIDTSIQKSALRCIEQMFHYAEL